MPPRSIVRFFGLNPGESADHLEVSRFPTIKRINVKVELSSPHQLAAIDSAVCTISTHMHAYLAKAFEEDAASEKERVSKQAARDAEADGEEETDEPAPAIRGAEVKTNYFTRHLRPGR